jgi:hypothetical protein
MEAEGGDGDGRQMCILAGTNVTTTFVPISLYRVDTRYNGYLSGSDLSIYTYRSSRTNIYSICF